MDRTLVLVVGAPKAGTFTIYNSFSRHPQVCVSKLKEPNYFVDAHFNAEGMKRVDNESDYIKQYSQWGSKQYFLEASPSYLRCPQSPEKIASFCSRVGIKNVKIVIVLRDPVERAFSNWIMDVRQGHQKNEFKKAFLDDYYNNKLRDKMLIQYEYYRAGLYYDDVIRFYKGFGEKNVLVLSSNKLKSSFVKCFRSIETFVGVDHCENVSIISSNEARIPKGKIVVNLYNNSVIRKAQRLILSDSAKEYLRAILFKPDNRKITDFLKKEELNELYKIYKEDRDKLIKILGDDIVYWGSGCN